MSWDFISRAGRWWSDYNLGYTNITIFALNKNFLFSMNMQCNDPLSHSLYPILYYSLGLINSIQLPHHSDFCSPTTNIDYIPSWPFVLLEERHKIYWKQVFSPHFLWVLTLKGIHISHLLIPMGNLAPSFIFLCEWISELVQRWDNWISMCSSCCLGISQALKLELSSFQIRTKLDISFTSTLRLKSSVALLGH